MSTKLQNKAQRLPFRGGSLTFRMCVVNRDWDTVKRMLPQQQDKRHGDSTLGDSAREYLRREAAKDGVTL